MTEYDNLNTEVTEEDLADAWTDEYGVKYSADRKRLLESDSNVGEYSIRKGTKVICDRAFYWSRGILLFEQPSRLASINIPDSVTSIGNEAFRGCEKLTSINIPDSVTSIGNKAFYWCKGLISIVVDKNNKKYDSRNGCNAIIEKASNKLIAGCENTIIPDGITSIGDGAFSECGSLTSINIPNSVTSIGNEAFYWCKGLTSINIPDSVTSIGNEAFYKCRSLTSINLPGSITSIGDEAFYGCYLTSINIPNSVTYIGKEAFRECDHLTSIDISNGVTSIGKEAFSGCSNLTSINIPDSVTSIGDRAFYECRSLTSINLPGSITSIGDEAFSECGSLTSINIPDGVTSDGYSAFDGCKSLTSINIPDSVTSIGDYAFSRCQSLTSINIPDSVTSIGDYAFYRCEGLTSINIPNSVTSIGYEAFHGCSALKQISFLSTMIQIDDLAFEECTSIMRIIIPKGTRKMYEKELPKYSTIFEEREGNLSINSIAATSKIDKYETKALSIPQNLGEMANSFNLFAINVKWKNHDNLEFIRKRLPLLKIKDGYILDAFEKGDEYGYSYRLYVHRLDASETYSPSVPYNESMLITNRLTSEESKEIPSIMSYFTVPFTEEGILQAWLLNNIGNYMPRGWHANYGRIKYIFNMEDIVHSLPQVMIVEEKNKILKMSPESFLPKVIIKDNEAVLIYLFWNGWTGLVRSNVKIRKVGNSIEFGVEKYTVLAEYDCGIIF